MSSPFAAATQVAAATVGAVMGDSFEFRPMKRADVNGRPAVDADRAITTFVAVFGDPSARAHSGAVRTVGVEAERAAHATSRPFISFPIARLPYEAKRGDHVFYIETGDLYQVAESLPSAPGHVRLDLNKIASA